MNKHKRTSQRKFHAILINFGAFFVNQMDLEALKYYRALGMKPVENKHMLYAQ